MISSEPATEKAKNDRALRFYRDVLGLERLHYGMWSPDDPLTMEALQAAQKRYEDFLIENVPEGVERILDVGCGSGLSGQVRLSLLCDVCNIVMQMI